MDGLMETNINWWKTIFCRYRGTSPTLSISISPASSLFRWLMTDFFFTLKRNKTEKLNDSNALSMDAYIEPGGGGSRSHCCRLLTRPPICATTSLKVNGVWTSHSPYALSALKWSMVWQGGMGWQHQGAGSQRWGAASIDFAGVEPWLAPPLYTTCTNTNFKIAHQILVPTKIKVPLRHKSGTVLISAVLLPHLCCDGHSKNQPASLSSDKEHDRHNYRVHLVWGVSDVWIPGKTQRWKLFFNHIEQCNCGS